MHRVSRRRNWEAGGGGRVADKAPVASHSSGPVILNIFGSLEQSSMFSCWWDFLSGHGAHPFVGSERNLAGTFRTKQNKIAPHTGGLKFKFEYIYDTLSCVLGVRRGILALAS